MTNNNFAEIECESPPEINNADIRVEKVVFKDVLLPGTELKYTCDSGYVMAPEYYVGVVCGDDGNYTALSTQPGFTTGECLPGSVDCSLTKLKLESVFCSSKSFKTHVGLSKNL